MDLFVWAIIGTALGSIGHRCCAGVTRQAASLVYSRAPVS